MTRYPLKPAVTPYPSEGIYRYTKDLQPDSLKDLVRAIDSIDKKLNERNPFTALKTSISQVQSTTLSVKEAQEAYNKAVREGTEAEQQNAKATLDAARNAKQKALAEATDSLHNSVGQVKEYVGAAEDLLGLVEQFGIDPPNGWANGWMVWGRRWTDWRA